MHRFAAVYGFGLSPNQTPYRDMYFLEKLVGLGADDGVKINIVFSNLCFLMGVWPAIYSSLLLPTAKSGNKVHLLQSWHICKCISVPTLYHLVPEPMDTSLRYLRERGSLCAGHKCTEHVSLSSGCCTLLLQVCSYCVVSRYQHGLLLLVLLLLAFLPWAPSLLCGHQSKMTTLADVVHQRRVNW